MAEQKKPDWLAEYRNNVTSQFGEDGVIQKIFDVIGTKNKWCVEFGAGDGMQNSNSWNLINNGKWSSVLIEGDRSEFEILKKTYGPKANILLRNSYVDTAGENSLDAILSDTPIPKDFDFLSIDIDGNDHAVWDALKKYEPRVVMAEFNGSIPPGLEFTQPQDDGIRSGSSLAAFCNLGKKKGYELVYARSANAIFVKKELYPHFGISDNLPGAIFGVQPERSFFQLYDGSIVLFGKDPRRLIAKKKAASFSLWYLNEGKLEALKFRHENRFARRIKDVFKSTPLYPYLRPYYPEFLKIKKSLYKLLRLT